MTALWSTTGKGLTSWLLFVMFIVFVVFSFVVSWVRCGTLLYRFLIFAVFLTLLLTRVKKIRFLIYLHVRIIRKPWRGILTYYLSLNTYYLLLITYNLLLITYYLSLITYYLLLIISPGRVAQSVTCLATDASLIADPGVASSIPARFHTFVEIDHGIISMV